MLLKSLIFLIHLWSICDACNNNFQYIRGENGGTEGLITFTPQRVAEHNLKVVLTVAAKLPSVSFSESKTKLKNLKVKLIFKEICR
jgi:hypothetical protein